MNCELCEEAAIYGFYVCLRVRRTWGHTIFSSHFPR